jgi:hypothetical protein
VSMNKLRFADEGVAGNPIYFVAIVRDVPWLLGSHAPWRWH